MQVKNGHASDVQIAYIGGGSRGWAWGLMADLALDGQMEGTVRLYDIDKDAAEKNSIIGGKLSAQEGAKGKWSYTTADTLAEALTGADFVVISILPGTFEEMRSDVHLPEKYGIYQPVGDTVGPGGLIRALRTVPIYAEFAGAIKEHCPNAWVINYTNPMTVCLRTLYTVFPQIKAFGCCHEVFGTQKLLAAMLKETHGINVSRQDIKTNVLGINHFTWFDAANCGGIDLMPVYRDFAAKYFENGFDEGGDKNWMNSSFKSAHRVKFDLFRRYGYIAAAGDRHLAEFCPGKWYLESPQAVKEWRFGLTTVDWRVQDLNNKLARRQRLVDGAETLDITGSGEEGHLLMKALLGLGDMVSNVNLPNVGQIENLPLGAVVETNAVFRADEVRPVQSGKVPANILGLVMRHVCAQESTVPAALECSRDLAISVFAADPLVNLSLADTTQLFDDMLKNTAAYLPAAWQA